MCSATVVITAIAAFVIAEMFMDRPRFAVTVGAAGAGIGDANKIVDNTQVVAPNRRNSRGA